MKWQTKAAVAVVAMLLGLWLWIGMKNRRPVLGEEQVMVQTEEPAPDASAGPEQDPTAADTTSTHEVTEPSLMPLNNAVGQEAVHRKWEPIYFDFDEARVRVQEEPKLQELADYLKLNHQLRLRIEGHCDKRGSEEYNRILGKTRAYTVRDALVERGVAKSRMIPASFGKHRPVSSEEGEQAHQLNRRAEFHLLPAR